MERTCNNVAIVAALVLGVVAGMALASSDRVRFRAQMTAEEFQLCGLHRLTAPELWALEGWLAGQPVIKPLGTWDPEPRREPVERPSTAAPAFPPDPGDPLVSFNLSSRKIHCRTCRAALQCTKNCVELQLSEARRRGGIPCGICGGHCP